MLSALLSVVFFVKNCDGEKKQVVLVLSSDSLGPNALKLGLTPNIEKFRREGSYAEYMIPRFPTKTIPNHVSIATGY